MDRCNHAVRQRMVTLATLTSDVPIDSFAGDLTIPIAGIEHHSKRIRPGMLFVCLLPDSPRAQQFLKEAAARGATAFVAEPTLSAFIQEHFPSLPLLVTRNPRRALGLLLRNWYGGTDPITFIGVTGTNGKTSVVWFLFHLLRRLGIPTASIGTLGVCWQEQCEPTGYTTPDPVILWQWIHTLRTAGIRVVAMETSSHALAQERLAGIPFQIGIFTNLTRDHLDYHGTMEHYAAAKAKLFAHLPSTATAILNADDPWSPFFAKGTPAQVLSYGAAVDATVRIANVQLMPHFLRAAMHCGPYHHILTFPPAAPFVLWNLAAALAACIPFDIPITAAFQEAEALPLPPGRFESFQLPNGALAVVDYAHTPDALRHLLKTLRNIATQRGGRLICVFGAGGERDRGKRPQMGAIAAQLADHIVITSDNPRGENPDHIAQDIIAGIPRAERNKMIVELDRRKAIVLALAMAQQMDVVGIAGKGHEQEQIIGTQRIPFSDQQVVRQWIQRTLQREYRNSAEC